MKVTKKKYARSVLNIFSALVIIFFFLALFIPYLIKGKVAEAVHKEAENMMFAKIEFSDIRIDMIRHFPLIGFKIEDIIISGTCNDFRNDTLLTSERIELTLSPISLLRKNGYEITSICLNKPRINTLVTREGKVNWNIFKSDTTHKQKDPLHPASYTSFHLKLKKIKLSDGKVAYLDLKTMHKMECLNLNADVNGDLYKNNPEINLNCRFDEIIFDTSSGSRIEDSNVSFKGILKADFSQQLFTFADNTLTADGYTESLKGSVSFKKEGFISSLNLSTKQIALNEVIQLINSMYLKNYEALNSCRE